MATAYLVLLIILLYYVFVFDPELDPYRPKNVPQQRVDRVNPIDRIVHRFTHIEITLSKPGGAQEVEKVFQKAGRSILLRHSLEKYPLLIE
jgi:hypothetical protein